MGTSIFYTVAQFYCYSIGVVNSNLLKLRVVGGEIGIEGGGILFLHKFTYN